jgi:hypothetical protein
LSRGFLLLVDVIIRQKVFVEDDNILDEQYNIFHRTLPLESEANIPPKQRTAKMIKAVLEPPESPLSGGPLKFSAIGGSAFGRPP